MKIVSFNIRYDTQEDGKYAFDYRKREIIARIDREHPDIIGFQETLPHVVDFLRDSLPDYYFVGHGRDADLGGEQGIVAYDRRKYDLMETHTLWLSPTPTVPGSRYEDQSVCPRTVIVCEFADRKTSDRVRVVNTHLDHIGQKARKKGLSLIFRHVNGLNLKKPMPTFITGDFNAEPTSPEIAGVLENPRNSSFFDASAGLSGTYHDYGNCPEIKIDYVLATTDRKVKDKGLWKCSEQDRFLSDHYPVWVEFEA